MSPAKVIHSDCRNGGPHEYEWITLGGYNAPSIDQLSCVWCYQTPPEPAQPKSAVPKQSKTSEVRETTQAKDGA